MSYLKCPKCGNDHFQLISAKKDQGGEIRTGTLSCSDCSTKYEISDGILNLLIDAKKIDAERIGWEILAKKEGWDEVTDEYLLELPRPKHSVEKLQWDRHANNFFFMLDRLSPLNGKVVLDVGAGRCWSSRYLARAGAEVVALDIVKDKYAGLLVSDVLMGNDKTYFERIMADMDNLPLKSESFDVVFFSGSLHHSNDLFRTLSESVRVLKHGGVLALTNEACGGIRNDELIDNPTAEGINEHTYHYTRYLSYMRKLGLITTTLFEYDHYTSNKLMQFVTTPFKEINRYLRATVLVAIAKKG